MPRIYSRTFHVRHYELNGRGEVNHAVYLNYFQQAAIEASADAGYDPERYRAMGVVWLVRKTIIEYGRPAVYGDALRAQTWISEFRRVQTHREYRLTHIASGQTVACARMNWAFLNHRTFAPVRIPPEMVAAFAPTGERAVRQLQPAQDETPLADARRYITHRRAQLYETDLEQHVNNAVYLNWIEQALWDACAAAGVPHLIAPAGDGLRLVARRHELEYRRPAVAGDEIEITTWLHAIAPAHHTWLHELRRVADGALLVRAYATHACLDSQGNPAPLPDDCRRAITG